ncbi:MAG: PDDEXK 1 protein, partial [Actinobacteria bacterium]|nr:PDDEXK 1 protein [Actinomycetota bacterium]
DGKNEKAPLEWILHGLSNQIPVYLSFANTLLPPPPGVRASLLFLRNGIRPVTVADEQWKAVREGWSEALSGWIALDRSGTFPPLPHHRFSYAGNQPPRYCDACPFADHCRVSPRFEGVDRETEALARRVGEELSLHLIGEHRPALR